MKKMSSTFNNEDGSMIVIVLLLLAVLSIVGISAVNTSNLDREIVGNNVRYQTAFYEADGGVEAGIELVEQDIYERTWTAYSIEGTLGIMTSGFCMNRDDDVGIDPIPSDTNQDVVIPDSALDTSGTPYTVIAGVPHTNLKFVGSSRLSTGSAIQLAAGYEGKGKGVGSGGAWIIYDIRAYHQGALNTSAKVALKWRHVM